MTSPAQQLLRHNLSLAEALARSGVKGGVVPGMSPAIQPVFVMGDFSQTYSGEPLEARGLAGMQTTTVPLGARAYIRLTSMAPGGIVVEYVSAQTLNALSTLVFLDVLDAPPTPSSFENQVTVLQIGGTLALGEVFEGDTLDPPSGAGEMELAPNFGDGPVQRIYVPPGSQLVVFSGVQSLGGLEMTFRFSWREIPAAIGLP